MLVRRTSGTPAWRAATVLLPAMFLLQACPSSESGPACRTGIPCVNDSDCDSGQRCNTALTPPECQTLYCGEAGSSCPCGQGEFCDGNRVSLDPESQPGEGCLCWGGAGDECAGDHECAEGFECDLGSTPPACSPVGGPDVKDDGGGGGGAKVSVPLLIYGPDSTEFPYEDPFAGCDSGPDQCSCDYVKVCWAEKGSDQLNECVTTAYQEMPTSASVPSGIEVCVVVQCYQGSLNPVNGQEVLDGPRAGGRSCYAGSGSGEDSGALTVYVLPLTGFGPTWAPEAGAPTSAFAELWGAAAVNLFDGTVLIAGGADLKDGCPDWADPNCVDEVVSTAELYNPGSRQVLFPTVGEFDLVGTDVSQRMSEQRAFAAAVALPSGDIAIFGGLSGANSPSKTVDIYSPTYRTFTAGPSMEHTRAYHSATLFSSAGDGFVLLVGGLGSGDSTWEVWTPELGTTLSGDLNESRWNHTATLVNKELDEAAREVVIIAGGEGFTPGAVKVTDTMEIFDIQNQDFQAQQPQLCSNGSIDSPASARKTLHAAAFVPARHFIYMAGGFSDPEHVNPVRDICVWHTTQEKWQGQAGTFMLKKARGALSATPLPGNVVLFAGGLTKSGGELQTVDTVEIIFEYVNSAGGTVVDIGPDAGFPITMLTSRWNHGTIVGCDGKVLFYGGLGGSPFQALPLQATEVFNPQ